MTIGEWASPPSVRLAREEHELCPRPVGRAADFVHGESARDQPLLDLVTPTER
jgi:hypothetical protein